MAEFSSRESSPNSVKKKLHSQDESLNLKKNKSPFLHSSSTNLAEPRLPEACLKTVKKFHGPRSRETSPNPWFSIFSVNRSRTRKPMQFTPTYSYLSDRLRRISAGSLQCALFCGGRGCKYENGLKWGREDQVLSGLYSHWVTPDIIAMARPSSSLIRDNELLEEFKRHGIGSVINLQQPGEHAKCGPRLEHSSGFTYRPEDLMDSGLYFYNYGWADYGVPTLPSLLGIVKVMDFALSEGKVAVHCHAGLGRTGVLIACYLIYALRLEGKEAIKEVRLKRPGSIQTRPQIDMVCAFSEFLRPLWVFLPPSSSPLSLSELLHNQTLILHGDQQDDLKHIPKVLHVAWQQMLRCCSHNIHSTPYDSTSGSCDNVSKSHDNAPESGDNKAGKYGGPSKPLDITSGSHDSAPISWAHSLWSCDKHIMSANCLESKKGKSVPNSLASWCEEARLSLEEGERLAEIMVEVNGRLEWELLRAEMNPTILLCLTSQFLTSLREPLVGVADDISWLASPGYSHSHTEYPEAGHVVLERLVDVIGTLVHCTNQNIDDSITMVIPPDDHAHTLKRNVARKLAKDLCQGSLHSNCEMVLMERWKVM